MESRFRARAASFLNHCNLDSSPLPNSFYRHSNPKHVEWDDMIISFLHNKGYRWDVLVSQIKVSPDFIFVCWGFSLWFADLIYCHEAEKSGFLSYYSCTNSTMRSSPSKTNYLPSVPPWNIFRLGINASMN